MNRKSKWAARAAVVGLSATVLVGVNTGSAEALGSTCTPPASRPDGILTNAVGPLFGSPGYGTNQLSPIVFVVTALLDAATCPLLP